ncbi:alpha-2-macroglobulin family protein [Pedobacter sp. JY14-1]|uniref:alpha-2-macroglobulin family protein n=1 Tax=Pedobacter sp. JY14-1 TaxID=3034151 RepID=UPI0023E129F7|nr:alpha-2-macroglobulin family protein [Pedobacter sp. JY14-1]
MKPLLFFLFSCYSCLALAQNTLVTSRSSSKMTYVYLLSEQDAYQQFTDKAAKPLQELLKNPVDSFPNGRIGEYKNSLPYGVYVYVSAEQNRLVYTLQPRQNLSIRVINDGKDFQFILLDSLGRFVDGLNAVQGRSSKVRYDQQARLYRASPQSKFPLIHIRYQGVMNYFSYNPASTARWESDSRRRKPEQPEYRGNLIFNKPKYKPLDTVKFKAYIVKANGKAIPNKLLRAELVADMDTIPVLSSLRSYCNGGFEGSFVLSDSLDLTLDHRYRLDLIDVHAKRRQVIFSSYFEFEDYQLSKSALHLRSSSSIHYPGSPVTLYIKATDENGFTLPDGRAEVYVIAEGAQKFFSDSEFIPKFLWQRDISLNPEGETPLTLPDSIFPRANLGFSVQVIFRSSDNEKLDTRRSFSYSYETRKVIAKLSADSILFGMEVNGRLVEGDAVLYRYRTRFGQAKDSLQVHLPAVVKIDPQVSMYTLKTPDGQHHEVPQDQTQPQFNIRTERRPGSLRLLIANPQQTPFWYTIFEGNKVRTRGYCLNLDTSMSVLPAKSAFVVVHYLWGDDVLQKEAKGLFDPENLDIKLTVPGAVYPGQRAKLQLQVTDAFGRPSPGTDLTSWAYTNKFGSSAAAVLPVRFLPDNHYSRQTRPLPYNGRTASGGGSDALDYAHWNRQMQLGQIPYYQFIYPDELYTSRTFTGDGKAVVVPFLVSRGTAFPAKLVYIDDRIVYYSATDQYQPYAFTVSPGRHKLTLITDYNKIIIEDEFSANYKTILGIVPDPSSTRATVSVLQSGEMIKYLREIDAEMLYIAKNFGDNKATITDAQQTLLLNPPQQSQPYDILRAGPFSGKKLVFQAGGLYVPFTPSPGRIHVFTQQGLNTRPLEQDLASARRQGRRKHSYRDQPATSRTIDSLWSNFEEEMTRSFSFSSLPDSLKTRQGILHLQVDTLSSRKPPFLKNIILYHNQYPDAINLYPGWSTYLAQVPVGNYRIILLLKDNDYIVLDSISVKASGTNFLRIPEVKIHPADGVSRALAESILSRRRKPAGEDRAEFKIPATKVLDFTGMSPDKLLELNLAVTDYATGETLPGAPVYYAAKGALKPIGQTDGNGKMQLAVPKKGTLTISYTGYVSQTFKIPRNGVLQVRMMEVRNELNEVVIRGYVGREGQGRVNVANVPVANIEQLLQGTVAGLNIEQNGAPGVRAAVNIRGTNTTGGDFQGMLIIDGKPQQGKLSDIDPSSIISVEVLKADRAMALYGDAGKNGVILVFTNGQPDTAAGDRTQDGGSGIRSNFSDYAIWEPRLVTDQEGKAAFTVTFPDDITSWITNFFAMNGKRQSGVAHVYIPSFKSLTASISTPQFLLASDRASVIGKLVNYNGKEEALSRQFSFNGQTPETRQFSIKNAHIDTLIVTAPAYKNSTDSLKFEYSLSQDNGYADGERRAIPVLPTGVKESKGYFSSLRSDTTLTYHADPRLGQVSLRAEASLFPVLLDEIDQLVNYEYLCNEQLASKLKGLLLEKEIRKLLKQDLRRDKEVNKLIGTLLGNVTSQGTWGWWTGTQEEMWISYHVTEALLMAQRSGYKAELKTQALSDYLRQKLQKAGSNDLLQTFRLLRLIDPGYKDINLPEKIIRSDSQPALFEQLQDMRLRQQMGVAADIAWLLKQKKQTMFGNSYWGEPGISFWDNSIQNTLLAYQLLKASGGHEGELNSIRHYFLEQRKDGKWRNTYESSLILETILPDLIAEQRAGNAPELTLNGSTIKTFPYTAILPPGEIRISKKGNTPVYFTAYQQFQNTAPEKAGRDFIISTSLLQEPVLKGAPNVPVLQAGKAAVLKVEVNVRANADYVMIEVPIPAGCIYESKTQRHNGIETHREYFKDKTTIFCSKLKQGKYIFDIRLLPRYSGTYTLNPAKAEMMYFPVFSGRDGMKKVEIRN